MSFSCMVSSLIKLISTFINNYLRCAVKPPPWKEKSSQAVPPAGHPAALCGKQHSYYIDIHSRGHKQHSYYIDIHSRGQVKLIENPLFTGFFGNLYIDFQNFFSLDIGVSMVIHISTLLLSIYPHFVENMWITPIFSPFLSTKRLIWLIFPIIEIVDFLLH